MTAGLFVPVVHGAALDRADEADTLVAAEAVADALAQLGYRTEIVGIDLNLSRIEELASRKPDLVFNLVEALAGDARLAHLAPAAFEHFGLRYTGGGSAALSATQSKMAAKRCLRLNNLPTPDWWSNGDAIPDSQTVIVKSDSEHASVGLDEKSVVAGRAAARAEIKYREINFGGRFFAERFIDGREFNVGILDGPSGPVILPMAEIVFDGLPADRPRIVDYDAKWNPESEAYHRTPRRFGIERGEPFLARRLRDLGFDCWRCFDLSGYARVDLRVAANGEPTILEINVNPALAPDSGFVASANEAGLSYSHLIARIVSGALESSQSPVCSASAN